MYNYMMGLTMSNNMQSLMKEATRILIIAWKNDKNN